MRTRNVPPRFTATGLDGASPFARPSSGHRPRVLAAAAPSKPVAVKRGGTFRVRINKPPVHFDPHQTAAYSTMVPLSFAYNRLVKVQNGSSVAPGTQPIEGDLADSWDSQGETVYVFKLR